MNEINLKSQNTRKRKQALQFIRGSPPFCSELSKAISGWR